MDFNNKFISFIFLSLKIKTKIKFQFLENKTLRVHWTKTHPEVPIPPPGTVMNKAALQRAMDINAKYNSNALTHMNLPRPKYKRGVGPDIIPTSSDLEDPTNQNPNETGEQDVKMIPQNMM